MPSRFEYERAIRASSLPPLSRFLALTLATWADVKTGVIPDRLMPSLTTLEESTGMVRSSVRTHLDRLEAGGWLIRKRPSVAAARSKKARTRYRIALPKGAAVPDSDQSEPGQETPQARAGDAPDKPPLGQETPQHWGSTRPSSRAAHAPELGQETPSRVPSGPHTSSEYQLHPGAPENLPAARDAEDSDALRAVQPLIDEMTRRGMRVSWQMQTGDWKELADLVRSRGVPALTDHAERVWRAAKTTPYSARYFIAGWRGLPDIPEGSPPALRAVSGGYRGPFQCPPASAYENDLGF